MIKYTMKDDKVHSLEVIDDLPECVTYNTPAGYRVFKNNFHDSAEEAKQCLIDHLESQRNTLNERLEALYD